MTYTKKMHDSIRRESKEKHTIATDLLDEIDRLNAENEKLSIQLSETETLLINYITRYGEII